MSGFVPSVAGAREQARAFFAADAAALTVSGVVCRDASGRVGRFDFHADRIAGELVAVIPEHVGPADTGDADDTAAALEAARADVARWESQAETDRAAAHGTAAVMALREIRWDARDALAAAVAAHDAAKSADTYQGAADPFQAPPTIYQAVASILGDPRDRGVAK